MSGLGRVEVIDTDRTCEKANEVASKKENEFVSGLGWVSEEYVSVSKLVSSRLSKRVMWVTIAILCQIGNKNKILPTYTRMV